MNRAPARLWDFPSAAILMLILLTASRALNSTKWAPGLGSATVLVVVGALLGLALGSSQFKRAGVYWLSFGYSIPTIILVLGSILYGGIIWIERIGDLSERMADSLGLLFSSRPVQDTALFVVIMALVFWITGLLAGYSLTRFGNFIGMVAPAGAALVIIQIYYAGQRGGGITLAVYFFLCVLELGRMTYAQRRVYWKEQGVAVLDESKTDLNVSLAIVAFIIVVLVWLAPTSAKSFTNIRTTWENLSRPLRTMQENLGHAAAGLRAPGRAQPVEFYGSALALGNQAATGDTEYFRIRTPVKFSEQRYYWRVRSYNIFLNDQWYTQDAANTQFAPGQATIPLAVPDKLTGEFVFTSLVTNLAVLVTPAGPVWVSRPSELVFIQAPDGKMDPVQLIPELTVTSGEQYSVHANVSEPTIAQLRNAGDTYPAWVTAEYLQLPDNLSPEIKALAQRISAQARTPYDRADAITQYLRTNITYASTVENPPAGQDSLDWFLFDSKKGFCNYYASAEVILLRSLGIPARMVVGFAQGEYTAPDLDVVRERDAHAWPEVYFPGTGWVEFEPTGNQAPIVRLPGESLPSAGQAATITPAFPAGQNVPDQPTPIPAGETGTSSGPGTVVNWLLGLLLICAIIFAILRMNTFRLFYEISDADQGYVRKSLPVSLKHMLENLGWTPPDWLLQWAYLASLNPVERSFVTVYRSLHWLGGKTAPAQTPADAAAALAARLPNVSKEIYTLLDEYQRQIYSQIHGRVQPARSAANAIRQEALRVAIQQHGSRFGGIFKHGRQ